MKRTATLLMIFMWLGVMAQSDQTIVQRRPAAYNLLGQDGQKFNCKIRGVNANGKVAVEKGVVYLLQNDCNGDAPNDTRGYKYGWYVRQGEPKQLANAMVTDFELYPQTRNECESFYGWGVGDTIASPEITATVEFRSGNIVVISSHEVAFTYTAYGLWEAGFRLKLTWW